jgi:L-fuconolactonase
MSTGDDAEPRSAAGVVVVDAHTHVACRDRDRFPVAPTGVGSDWWSGDGGEVDALVAEMDEAGVAGAVVVQAVGVYGHDCACAAHSVARHPGRLALVVSVDMESVDPSAELHDLVAHLGTPVAGVRLFGVGAAGAAWLHDGRGPSVMDAAGSLALTVVPCVFAPDLDAVAALAARRPDVAVAVDHCGFADREGAAGWEALDRLVDVPSVSLKVSSYVLEAAERDDGDPAGVVDRLTERFGSERTCWGSDHPQDQARDYAGKLALARHAARHLDDQARRRFFHDTARRLWFRRGAPGELS